MKKKKLLITGIIIVLISSGFSTIQNKDLEIVKNLDIYFTLFRELNMFYVDETDPEELVTTSINAMLSSLDPYTTYIPEASMDDFQFQTTGEYGGIGSLIRRSGTHTIIAEPYEGFPAAKSGLRAGDVLLEIDGKPTDGLAIETISDMLKGKPGTELRILIERYGEDEPIKFTLTREKISISNVPYYGTLNDGKTGYIRISNFTSGAGKEVEIAFRDLKSEQQIESLILDLRSNPGGLLIEAVRICNLFVDKGLLIVNTKGRVKQWDSEYVTQKSPLDKEIPIVVLVNRASASAAEIVAGALQDLDRAVIVGQRTFGKGLVQTSRPLKYNAQLKVTTAKYYIPSGRCIQALDYTHRNEDGSVGFIPDSLISEYKTRNGRMVYDGGGIQPDFEIIPELIGEITIQLYTQNLIFDYATRYAAMHPEIGSPDGFSLSDEDYLDFQNFVETRGFSYQTETEQIYNELVTTAKKEKYYQVAEEAFLKLEEKLMHDNLQDLETFRPEIQELLQEEIVNRFYYQAGRVQAQIQNDIQLDKATELLQNPQQVEEILNGQIGALAIERTEAI
ncbi:MAG: S41 family peptidase [Bacteroidales bacterium]|nr:S41 family peptidase [Bacteroidales bacterium]MBN2699193.1 S41 family peptidase [Bacteroidales bacterium]